MLTVTFLGVWYIIEQNIIRISSSGEAEEVRQARCSSGKLSNNYPPTPRPRRMFLLRVISG